MTDAPMRSWPILLAGLAVAGAAHAQTAPRGPAPPLRYEPQAVRPVLDLSGPSASMALPYQDQGAMSPFPHTAVDHSFSPERVTGSIGYLCGLHPGPDAISGPAASSDPVGTFLGAKLSYAF